MLRSALLFGLLGLVALCSPQVTVAASYNVGTASSPHAARRYGTAMLGTTVVSSGSDAETLVFFDDFNEFDLSVWQHEITMAGGGNWQFEYSTNNRSNTYVRDSKFFLKPTLTADNIGEANVHNGFTMDIWGSTPADICTANEFYGCSRTSTGANLINPIQSASLRTVNSFNLKYGRLEVRAQLPRGDWLWPAIWMMPTYNSYGQWPTSGEIDIVESKGNAAGSVGGGVDSFSSTLHWGHNWQGDNYPQTHAEYKLSNGRSFSDDFHIFGMRWSNESLYTYVDKDVPENRVLTVDFTKQSFWQRSNLTGSTYDNPWAGRPNAAPFDQSFYLIFDVAVGGINGYFPDNVDGKPWSDKSGTAAGDFYNAKAKWLPTWQGEKSALQVDWVKAWSL